MVMILKYQCWMENMLHLSRVQEFHIAPSHGPDDFHLSLKNKILVENTLEDDGTYTDKIKKIQRSPYL